MSRTCWGLVSSLVIILIAPSLTPSPGRAKYRRLLPCIRGSRRECASVALAATHCGKNAPTASGDDGFAAHLSRLASLSPGLRSRRPFTSRWVFREAGVSLASQSDAVWDFSVGQLERHKCLSFRSDRRSGSSDPPAPRESD